MYYTYVLFSVSKRRFYVGWSSNLRKRLRDHNHGKNVSTRFGMPWVLLYYEAYQSESLARDRERVLKKRGKLWQSLRKRIYPIDSA
jgi:putative endonuclease